MIVQIKELERRLESTEKELEQNEVRITRMLEHKRNLQAEFGTTQALSMAKVKELETEQHLRQLAERETGKIRVETEKSKNIIKESRERVN